VWINNLQTLPSDFFPKSAVASVFGLGGTSAAIASVLYNWGTGRVVDAMATRRCSWSRACSERESHSCASISSEGRSRRGGCRRRCIGYDNYYFDYGFTTVADQAQLFADRRQRHIGMGGRQETLRMRRRGSGCGLRRMLRT
jgi:hypothetical protein